MHLRYNILKDFSSLKSERRKKMKQIKIYSIEYVDDSGLYVTIQFEFFISLDLQLNIVKFPLDMIVDRIAFS